MSLLQNGQVQEAEDTLQEVLTFSQKLGMNAFGRVAYGYLGVVSIIRGRLSQGLKMLEEINRFCIENDANGYQAMFEFTLGKVYLQMVEGPAPNLPTMLKNIGFLIRNVPFAAKKAEAHFNTAIEIAKEIKADGLLGQAYLDLGLLHKTKKKTNQARECISKAMEIFERYETEVYLKQAKEALEKLG
jgi:tetratricopeptide (TPR) repeat protein